MGILSLFVNYCIIYVEQRGFSTSASPVTLDGMVLYPKKRRRNKREVGRKETQKNIRINIFKCVI